MALNIVYYDEIIQDVKEAKTWYKQQKKGLELRFSNAIRETITAIETNPFEYSIRYKSSRIAFSKVFPYRIHFFIDEANNKIVIFAILHTSMNPIRAEKRT